MKLPDGYRELKSREVIHGEIIKKGDRCWDGGRWRPVDESVGEEYTEEHFIIVRRRKKVLKP